MDNKLIKQLGSARFVASSLLSVIKNLAERIEKKKQPLSADVFLLARPM